MNNNTNDEHSQLFFIWFFTLFLFFFLPSCTPISMESRILSDPKIEIIVKPMFKDSYVSNIGVFDFRSDKRLGNLGQSLAANVAKHLVTKQSAEGIELAGPYNDEKEDPIDIGERKGYELILLGYINDFFYGGLIGDSRVDISLRMIDVQTRMTLSYVRGEIDAPYIESTDCLFIKIRSQEPPPPDVLSAELIKKLVDALMDKNVQRDFTITTEE